MKIYFQPINKYFFLILPVCIFCCPMKIWAQGCSLCVKNAAAAGLEAGQALNTGILLLLLPSLLIFTGIISAAFIGQKPESIPGGSQESDNYQKKRQDPPSPSNGSRLPVKPLDLPFSSG